MALPNPKSELPLTLTVPDVAKLMGINKTAAYALSRSDGFPSICIGKRIVIPRDAFLRWLDRAGQADNSKGTG